MAVHIREGLDIFMTIKWTISFMSKMLQVTLSFIAKALGEHSLPIQLQITDGRRLRLDLQAQAVEHSAKIVQLPGSPAPAMDGNLVLQPVAIGDLQPPMQMFSFRNAGVQGISWHLDLRPLQELVLANWGCVRVSKNPAHHM
jgi:cilia- and flagella-associated protein 65